MVGAIVGLMVILLCICTCSGGMAVFVSLWGRATATPKIVYVGESVEEKGWEVMITDYPRLADKVGDATMQNLYETPEGMFLIVPIQLKNMGDVGKRGWAYTAYKIIDETGEEFEADLDATYAHMTVSNISRVSSLEPGARWEGELVFDIPADVRPLKLRIESFDENVLFDLEM